MEQPFVTHQPETKTTYTNKKNIPLFVPALYWSSYNKCCQQIKQMNYKVYSSVFITKLTRKQKTKT